jgi:quaternary ammonium compound-resistance protein SugE
MGYQPMLFLPFNSGVPHHMPWFLLILAGVIESLWAVGLKYTNGFTRPVPSVLTGLGIVVSLYLLSVSAKSIPIGTAYAIWTGIGAGGAVLLGILFLGESANPLRLFFVLLLLVAVTGLKYTTK